MIVPFAKDEVLLADIAGPIASADELRIWWLGQSGFLLRCQGSLLLMDPYLSDSLTRKYAATDKPHTRMTEQVCAPGALRNIEVVTSSHNHTDHLDADTLLPLFSANPRAQFIIPEANREFVAARLGCEASWPIGLDAGVTVHISGWEITGIPAAHNSLQMDELGRHHFLGYIVRRAGWTLYHSGDTLLYPGLAETLAEAAVDVAFLPINGNRPERRVAGNLDGAEAARLASETGVRWAVPHHYEMFEFNTADPQESFIPECLRLRQAFHVMRAGKSWSVPR